MRIIAGEFKGRKIKTGNGPGYRPATGKVRESVFSMLESRMLKWTGTNVLDIFAGSGSLGLEALSRGANSALFIEKSSGSCATIRQNIAGLGISPKRARVIKCDAPIFLKRYRESTFDLVFVDPPYGMDLARPVLDELIKAGLVGKNGFIIAEVEKNLKFEAKLHSELELIKDRNFGQTRILIWENI